MIDKELLSEVLDIPIIEVQQNLYKNRLYYKIDDESKPFNEGIKHIPIFELAHKCKEWAFSTHNVMVSSSVSEATLGIATIKNDDAEIEYCEIADSEPQAIFKACQWILDNKN